ncbi:hypothetical protein [Mucilaginibacter sp.]|uniref:hypothetical protein n=1 Tax=Mucilaginibacter sp. TaxID=1882438 RepID=UPI0025F1E165|nr:hypothetical protein [Mucilaginibacter sp.]
MATATKGQIAKIHVLLNNLGIAGEKASILNSLTNGRTESTKQLTIIEARQLIVSLSGHDPAERLKSLIFSLGYQSGILYGSTADDKKMNAAKLNMFLKERGAVKKELNQMRYGELVKTHRQFEAIVSNTKKTADNKSAKKVVKNLLNELNLTTL